jgi:hypothetical protein
VLREQGVRVVPEPRVQRLQLAGGGRVGAQLEASRAGRELGARGGLGRGGGRRAGRAEGCGQEQRDESSHGILLLRAVIR